MECKKFGLSIGEYLDDSLGGDDRRAFRKHMQTCVQCRADAIACEPSLMFASIGSLETDDRAVDECAEAVTALIRQDRLSRRLTPRFRPWLAAAAACLVLLAGGFVWRSSIWTADPSLVVVTTSDSEGVAEESAPPPRVEIEMPESEVRLYQFAGSEDETTAVYFIVNEAMEL